MVFALHMHGLKETTNFLPTNTTPTASITSSQARFIWGTKSSAQGTDFFCQQMQGTVTVRDLRVSKCWSFVIQLNSISRFGTGHRTLGNVWLRYVRPIKIYGNISGRLRGLRRSDSRRCRK